jgi:hypothetical protein
MALTIVRDEKMKNDMKVAIVILNWNGQQMLSHYLPTVLNYSQDEATVFVADNASTDGSLDLLRTQFPTCRVIELDRNWGFAEGYNQALKQIDAEYYLLLNSDIEVTHHWLTPLVEFMDVHPEVAACQPKMLSVYNKDMFEYAGACGGYLDHYGYPYCRGRIFETVEEDDGQYDYPAEVLWATGAALMIRSKDYWSVGGLDARFFAHNEEIDLCWRLRIKGRKIYCLPESYVYHVGGGTLPKSNPMKTFLNFRNNLTMLYKCLPDAELKPVMRWRWFLDYLAAWEMLILKGNFGDFKAIFKARHAFKSWRKDFDADRKVIQESRIEDHVPQRSRFSLLWQYYARGRKRFSDLLMLLVLLFTSLSVQAQDADVLCEDTCSHVHGIDLSHYQGNVFWETVGDKTPMAYVYLKATEGGDRIDETFERNIMLAHRHGIRVGSYHFYRPRTEQVKQLENFKSQCLPREQDLIPMIDVESTGGLPVEDFRDSLSYFLELVEEAYHQRPLIYTGRNFYNKYLQGMLDGYKLMIAMYTDEEPVLADEHEITLWQYTGKGRLTGVKGYIDKSRFMGNHSLFEIRYRH